jgi:hypothetical protein
MMLRLCDVSEFDDNPLGYEQPSEDDTPDASEEE